MFTIFLFIYYYFFSKFCNHVDGCFEVHIYYAENFFNIYDENVYQINMITLCNWKMFQCPGQISPGGNLCGKKSQNYAKFKINLSNSKLK